MRRRRDDTFTVQITQRGNDTAVATIEARNVSIEGEILSMLVVGAMADAVANVMQQGGGFQLDAGLRGQMVNCLELIEEHERLRRPAGP